VDLDHAAARQATDAECDVEAERAGRDRLDTFIAVIAHAHHGALAELLLDLAEGGCECAALVVVHRVFLCVSCCVERTEPASQRVRFRRTGSCDGSGSIIPQRGASTRANRRVTL